MQQIHSTKGSFAAILADGSVATWGYPRAGGDSSSVGDRFRSVKQFQASSNASAAILADGSVMTWGDPNAGGNSSAVHSLADAGGSRFYPML